ncbi:hypothetical protein [Kingella kingae]|uniref:hypothetical protein n=1 Tax=Kingella kingae TaxID=504 RepID=UPI00040C7A07|nr:hypothetical protein [Kingella kingae]
MNKTLIIAVNPSMAKEIAAALGVPRHKNYYECMTARVPIMAMGIWWIGMYLNWKTKSEFANCATPDYQLKAKENTENNMIYWNIY